MKVKTMTPVIDDLCALHFTIPDILLCTLMKAGSNWMSPELITVAFVR